MPTRYINIHGVIARIIISDGTPDNDVIIHSDYHDKVFKIDDILHTIGFLGNKLDPAFKAYECNSDTFDKFLDYFKEIKNVWEVQGSSIQEPLPPIEKWHDNFGE